MARERQSIAKMSRREGYALHPKAHKILAKRTSKPGQNNTGGGYRAKPSQYSIQLREKQKVRRLYGLLERQFRKLLAEASKTKGQSGTTLLAFLERRLDNVIYRAGYASSRPSARQLVGHGHFMLNGRRVDIPSIRVKEGDKITIRPSSQKNAYFTGLDDNSPSPNTIPTWLKANRKSISVEVVGKPTRDDAEVDINEQLIIEYYSR
jgi:small subunit ribosomal protein S4